MCTNQNDGLDIEAFEELGQDSLDIYTINLLTYFNL